jgi:hypothetical protein
MKHRNVFLALITLSSAQPFPAGTPCNQDSNCIGYCGQGYCEDILGDGEPCLFSSACESSFCDFGWSSRCTQSDSFDNYVVALVMIMFGAPCATCWFACGVCLGCPKCISSKNPLPSEQETEDVAWKEASRLTKFKRFSLSSLGMGALICTCLAIDDSIKYWTGLGDVSSEGESCVLPRSAALPRSSITTTSSSVVIDTWCGLDAPVACDDNFSLQTALACCPEGYFCGFLNYSSPSLSDSGYLEFQSHPACLSSLLTCGDAQMCGFERLSVASDTDFAWVCDSQAESADLCFSGKGLLAIIAAFFLYYPTLPLSVVATGNSIHIQLMGHKQNDSLWGWSRSAKTTVFFCIELASFILTLVPIILLWQNGAVRRSAARRAEAACGTSGDSAYVDISERIESYFGYQLWSFGLSALSMFVGYATDMRKLCRVNRSNEMINLPHLQQGPLSDEPTSIGAYPDGALGSPTRLPQSPQAMKIVARHDPSPFGSPNNVNTAGLTLPTNDTNSTNVRVSSAAGVLVLCPYCRVMAHHFVFGPGHMQCVNCRRLFMLGGPYRLA